MDASRELSRARQPEGGGAHEVSGDRELRRALRKVRRLVVKVGSSLIAAPGVGADPDRIDALAAEIARVRKGREVVLVTSGAIATGVARLALAERPRSIPEKQAAAAVGQSALPVGA